MIIDDVDRKSPFLSRIFKAGGSTGKEAGLYSKHVPIVPVLVKLWSGLVNFGSWWPGLG